MPSNACSLPPSPTSRRAKDELHCYTPLRTHHHPRSGGVRNDAHGYAPLSRFLDDGVLATMSREGIAIDAPGLATLDDPGVAADVDAAVAALLR